MSALSNALYLIKKATDHQAEGLTFTALNDGSNIARGSAHRILKELVALRVLDYDEQRKTYRGGLLLANLGSQIIEQYDLRKNARPAMLTLHQKLGHVVTLGIRDGTHGIYIDKIETKDFGLRLHSEIGKAFPLHCTAMGKILLSHADEKTRRQVLKNKLPELTQNTITEPSKLAENLTAVMKNGYAIDDEEITRGLSCVAAPIFGPNKTVVGALSYTCPKHIFDEQNTDDITKIIIQQAELISA